MAALFFIYIKTSKIILLTFLKRIIILIHHTVFFKKMRIKFTLQWSLDKFPDFGARKAWSLSKWASIEGGLFKLLTTIFKLMRKGRIVIEKELMRK
jgi:hypothetical protein